MNDGSSILVSNLIYSGLLSFGPNLEIRGEIAKSWITSADRKAITLQLREDALFHNGERVTGKDVVASLERLMAKNSKVYSYYDCVEGAEEFNKGTAASVSGLRAHGLYTVVIKLKYPFPPFLSVLAGATAKILPSKSVSKKSFFEHPIGAGPFVYGDAPGVRAQSELTLTSFPRFFGTKPKIQKLILRVIDEKLGFDLAANGKIDDLSNFVLNGTESIFKQGNHLTAPVAATWIIGINSRIKPFEEKTVRIAFRDAFDQEDFRQKFYPDALPANGYIPPGLPGYAWGAMSKKKTTPQVSFRNQIEIAIPKELSRHLEMKKLIEANYRSKGWNVTVVPMDWKSLMEGYSSKKLQAFLVSMNMDYPDTEFLVRNFESKNSDNFSGISSPKIDALILKARSTFDRQVRHKIYFQLVQEIEEQALTINLFYPRAHIWTNECVRGLEPSMLADTYIDYRTVYVDSKCRSMKPIARNE
jgi:peptide/nickel transport system substrate-binding protein/oligopeptide transport system substrate-binding protein